MYGPMVDLCLDSSNDGLVVVGMNVTSYRCMLGPTDSYLLPLFPGVPSCLVIALNLSAIEIYYSLFKVFIFKHNLIVQYSMLCYAVLLKVTSLVERLFWFDRNNKKKFSNLDMNEVCIER